MTRDVKRRFRKAALTARFSSRRSNPSPDASVIVKIRPILELLIESIRGVARVLQCLL